MTNLKDTLTTIAGLALLIFTAIQQYIASIPVDGSIDWFKLIAAVVVAVVAYFTGKNANGTKKSPAQLG